MSINISAKQVEPLRVNYSHIARRIGDTKAATRYQEAVYDIQPTENFHYPPTWDPEHKLFDESRTAINGRLVHLHRSTPVLLHLLRDHTR